MTTSSTPSRRLRCPLRPTAAAALTPLAVWAVLAVLSPAGVAAAEPEERYTDRFNGSFVEYGVRAGRSLTVDHDGRAWSFDAGIRQSFPMLLGDLRLAYRYDDFEALAGLDGEVDQHGLGLALGLHPFYILLLGSDWVSYVASSFYLELGLGAQYVALSRVGGEAEGDLGVTWSLGSGIDIPLGDPDVGWAPWVNVLYRYHRGDLDLDNGGEVDLYLHTLFVGLSLRINGLLI